MNGFLSSLYISLRANTGDFETDMGRAARVAKQQSEAIRNAIEQSVSHVGGILAEAFAIDKLIEFGKSTLETADQISKLSQKVGISTESLSGLKHAAELSDVSMEALQNGIVKLDRASVGALQGNKQYQQAFKDLGVTLTDSQGHLKANDALFGDVAESISHYKDGAAKAAVAQQLFGKTGADLIPLLNEGRDGLKESADEAQRLGLVISGDTGRAAEAFNDNMTRLKESAQGLGYTIVEQLLPSMVSAADAAVEFVKSLHDNGTFQAIGDGIKFVVDNLGTLAVFFGANFAFSAVATGIAAITSSASLAAAAVAALDGALALLGGPIGIAVTLLAAGAAAAYHYATAEDEVTKAIKADKEAHDLLASAHGQAILDANQQAEASRNEASARLNNAQAILAELEAKTEAARNDPINRSLGGENNLSDNPYGNLIEKQKQQVKDLQDRIAKDDQQQLDKLGEYISNHAPASKKTLDVGNYVSTDKLKSKLEAATKTFDEFVAGLTNRSFNTGSAALDTYASSMASLNVQYEKFIAAGGSVDQAVARFDEGQKALLTTLGAARLKEHDSFIKSIDEQEATLRGPASQAALAYTQRIKELDDALALGTISQEEFQRGVDIAQQTVQKGTNAMSEFAVQAAHNIQDSLGQAFENLFTGAKGTFSSLLKSWGDTLLKMIAQAQAAQLAKALFGDSYGSSGQIGGLAGSVISSFAGSFFPAFANGGVMTSGGPVPLRAYAGGGIASSPQMAMFGEGSTPEAYVPLPDGRSIPVSLRGGAGGGGQVQVNVHNYSDQEATVNQSSNGGASVIDVIIGKAVNEVDKRIRRRGSTFQAMSQTFGLQQRGLPVGG